MAKCVRWFCWLGLMLFWQCAIDGTNDDVVAEILHGTHWLLQGMGITNFVDVLEGTEITLIFEDAEEDFWGSAGCNQYSGSYRQTGYTVEMRNIVSTEMACEDPPGIMDQEGQYLTILADVVQWDIAGDNLILRSNSGWAMIFVRIQP